METLRTVVLASGSPRRLELLRSLGLQVEVLAGGYDETPRPVTPAELAALHARGKLEAAIARPALRDDHRAIVASDTVVDLDGDALGKPRDPSEAQRMLGRLSGRQHTVHTAFALRVPGGRGAAIVRARSATLVRFCRLSHQQIAAYVATGDSLDKAGAYGIAGRGAALVDSIDGDFYTVMGFPLGRFIRTLADLGFSIPAENNVS